MVFKKGKKMVREEGLELLQKNMRTLDPDQQESYKIRGVEQGNGIKTKKVYERVKGEVKRRINLMTKSELNGENCIRDINMEFIPVANYANMQLYAKLQKMN